MSGVSVAEKRAQLEAAGEEWPACDCHGEPKGWHKNSKGKQGGYWLCKVEQRRAQHRYKQSEKWREKERRYEQSEKGREKQRRAQHRYKQSEKWREVQRRYKQSEKGRETKRSQEARRIRICAGGIQFHIGYAPTTEAAQYLRDKIKKEAPGALHS